MMLGKVSLGAGESRRAEREERAREPARLDPLSVL
jgi:hypothetical protein